MPGYNTHLSWGAALGVGLGFVAKVGSHAPMPEAFFGGFLCALGSILPDIDSDKSAAHRRCMTAISGSAALLLASRLRDFMLRPETVLLVGAFVYFALFYGVGSLIQKFSVHRGMFHSIPFGIICAELIFIISSGSSQLRLFKAGCIFFGVMIHLVLDELSSAKLIPSESSSSSSRYYSNSQQSQYNDRNRSLQSRKKKQRSSFGVKKSFGTALKLIDFKHFGSTIFFYCVVLVLGNLALNVQTMLSQLGDANISELRGKAAVDRVRAVYPTQFDLTVVQWVAENDLVLSPGADNNVKWHELEDLLSLSDDVEKGESKHDSEGNSESEKKVTLLDVVNWNSMNTPNSDNLENPVSK